MYTYNQFEAIIRELQAKIIKNNITDKELVILALILEKTKKINVNQVSELLMRVMKDKDKILESLNNTRNTITDNIINEIIKDVK